MPVKTYFPSVGIDPDHPERDVACLAETKEGQGTVIKVSDLPALAREAAEEIFRRFDVLARPDLDQTPYSRNVFHPEIEKIILEKWGIK